MGRVELWVCDNCGAEERTDLTLGWRQLSYLSNVRRAQDDTNPATLCSWECVSKYAEKMMDSGRYWSAPAM